MKYADGVDRDAKPEPDDDESMPENEDLNKDMETNANESEAIQKPPASPVNLKFNFIDFEPENEQEKEKKKNSTRRSRQSNKKKTEKPKDYPDAETDINTFYSKQLKLEFVRASYIVITYLTQKQPAFTQTDIEKFITYIIARSFSQPAEELEEVQPELALESSLNKIIESIHNLKKVLEHTLQGLSLNSKLDVNSERLRILDCDLFEHMLF